MTGIGAHRRKVARILFRFLGVILAANAVFLLLVTLSRPDRSVIVERVRAAFTAGELGSRDYLPWDARRGWHQYNDCLALQMLTNANPSRIAAGVAPVIYKTDEAFNVACPVLEALVMGGADPDTLLSFRYGRYWHAHNAVAGLALRIVPLRDLRRLLTAAIWLAAGVLAMVTWRRGGRLRLAGSLIALTALGFWGAPYFAPGLTHGPGDTLLLLGVAGVAAWPRIAGSPGGIALYAAGFGATIAFFDMLTGQLPTGAGWLTALTLAAARDGLGRAAAGVRAIAMTAPLAFAVGAAATVAIKQVLAFTLVESETWRAFLSQLHRYSSSSDALSGMPPVLVPYAQLGRRIEVLTWGNEIAGYALVACVSLVGAAAAMRGWQLRKGDPGKDMLLLIGAALIPFAWVMVLPQHTSIHASFMVRMLVVPIAIAPLALLWPHVQPGGTTRRVGDAA